MQKILFKEEQRFNQLWLKVPLYVLAGANTAVFLYGLQRQLIAGQPWGNNPMSDNSLIAVTCVTIAVWITVIFFLEKAKLISEIREHEIMVRFPPFINKAKIYPVASIRKMEIRKYNPIWEYGGWGIRHGIKGKAYNVRGNIGLQIYLKSGKSLLIGTQKPEQVKWAVNKIESNDR